MKRQLMIAVLGVTLLAGCAAAPPPKYVPDAPKKPIAAMTTAEKLAALEAAEKKSVTQYLAEQTMLANLKQVDQLEAAIKAAKPGVPRTK